MWKRIKEFLCSIVGILLQWIFKLLWALPTAYMIGYSCDNLFDTMLLDNFIVIYLTLILTIPMVVVQFTSYKKESK